MQGILYLFDVGFILFFKHRHRRKWNCSNGEVFVQFTAVIEFKAKATKSVFFVAYLERGTANFRVFTRLALLETEVEEGADNFWSIG